VSVKIEVVEVNEDTALAAFSGEVKLQNILDYVAHEARAYELDASTLAGRKEITSVAYNVSRSKTLIDSVGKGIVSEWKEKAKGVDAQRKLARDFLDDLRDEIRKPVNDWEEEQKRIAEEARLKEDAEQAAKLADLERREAEMKAKEDAFKQKEEDEHIEKERVKREDQIAKEAAELAVETEQARVQKEKDAELAAIKKREANKTHKTVVNNAAKCALINAGLSEKDAKTAVIAIAQGKIAGVRIEY